MSVSVWRVAGAVAGIIVAPTKLAMRPAPALAFFLVLAVLAPFPLNFAAPVVVFDFSLAAFMSVAIPMSGPLAAITAAMTALVLPRVRLRGSEGHSEHHREYRHTDQLHSLSSRTVRYAL